MANERFWNLDRISYFWGKIKSLVNSTANNKVDKVAGKGLSTNDYTDADQTALQTTLPGRISAIENAKGANSGYAELDANGKVPSNQLPSYVDDVEEYATVNDFPQTGESGKIYVATSTNITYRWGGSEYVPIGSDLALGETSSTAYRGDRGKAAYDHATAKGSAFNSGLYKITTNSEGHVTAASAVQKSDITALGIPGSHQDISGKADKVSSATSGNFAGLDSNGNLTDSGSKASDFLTQHQDISGKADKVSSATSGNFAGLDVNGNLTDSGHKHSDYLTQHQDISGKTDKVSGATSGNFAGLDSNGNLTDSGSKASDFLTQHQDISGKVDKNQGVAHAGKALGINAQGMVEPVTFSGDDFTGATSSTAGTHGYVPAPAATDNTKYLKGDGTWADVLPSVTSSDNGKSLEVINGEWTTGNEKIDKHFDVEKFEEKTWTGLTNFDGYSVWTDGENIYYSYNAKQYVLDKSTSTWSAKTWTGLTNFDGLYIWTDGENIYYSKSTTQYVLDKSTSTWSRKTWTGLTSFDGYSVWTDGENIYYSNSTAHYVLDKSTSTWSAKNWTGLTSFNGLNIWTDGENIYYSDSSDQYILDKSTSTWSAKTWTGLTNFIGNRVWTDGENIYYSNSTTQYVLDKSTSTWSAKTWTGLTSFYGTFIWTDGKNIYYSDSSSQYKLNNIYLLLGRNGTFVPVSISDVVSSPVTMTGADGANAGTAGYVPAPAAGDQDKVLHGDGTWKTALNNNFVKVWENPNPSANFAAQTLSVDLSAYRFILIVTTDGTGWVEVGIMTRNTLIMGGSTTILRAREFKANTNSIECGNAYGGGTMDNSNCIPQRIYGVK